MHAPQFREDVRKLAREGVNDCEIARRTGLPRTTVRDIRKSVRRPHCPRCWRATRLVRFSEGEYAELLGLYLGDGCIVTAGRTQRLRLCLDSRYPTLVADAARLLRSCLPENRISSACADGGATTVLSVYSSHLTCLLPQHGVGKKHERRIVLEPWQRELLEAAPWSFLRGCVHSDGCLFINRTGRYRYLSVDFHNLSPDILDLFEHACDLVGVDRRRYARHIRIYGRDSAAKFAAFVGAKR
ncbi:MAG: hypothetical protein M3134_05190 [Actinomycetota bacterium]|nr:hypothetical protein [Actinomycetota bacterium]